MKRIVIVLLVLPLVAGLTEYGCHQQADECKWVLCRGSYDSCISGCAMGDEDCNYYCGQDFSECKENCEWTYHSCLGDVNETEVILNQTPKTDDAPSSPLGSYIRNADYDLSGVFFAVLVVLAILVFMVSSRKKDTTPALRGEK
jgi:hypothetical protein